MTLRTFAPPALALALAACNAPARVEVDPASLQLWEPAQTARVKAVALASNGKALPDKGCAWSSSDPGVATVAGAGREAVVTAAASGSAAVRCTVGSAFAEVVVAVRLVARLEVEPAAASLRLEDEPRATPLAVRAYDAAGQQLTPHRLRTRCADEAVCRGDDRGQLWPVGAGRTRCTVEADGRGAEVAVEVADVRTAAGKPRAVTGNPMEKYEKAYQIIRKDEQKAAGKRP